MEHIDATKKSDTHPQAHAVVKRRSALPPLVVEIGVAVTAGWAMYAATNDWKQGVSAMLAMLFGGLVHRGGVWWLRR